MLGDHRKNTEAANAKGDEFYFDDAKVKYVRVTFTKNSAGNASGGHIVEIEGYALSKEAKAKLQQWKGVASGLDGSFASIDRRYRRSDFPAIEKTNKHFATAWRGERVNSQILLWAGDNVEQVRIERG